MAFVAKLIITFGKFAITVLVIAILLYATIWLLNRLVQLVADGLGVEVKDFFQWLKEKLPKKKEAK